MVVAPEGLIIREATAGDRPAVAQIYAGYVRDSTASFEPSAPDIGEMHAHFAALHAAGMPYLIAAVDGGRGRLRVCGCISVAAGVSPHGGEFRVSRSHLVRARHRPGAVAGADCALRGRPVATDDCRDWRHSQHGIDCTASALRLRAGRLQIWPPGRLAADAARAAPGIATVRVERSARAPRGGRCPGWGAHQPGADPHHGVDHRNQFAPERRQRIGH